MKSRRFTALPLCQGHTVTQHCPNLRLKSPSRDVRSMSVPVSGITISLYTHYGARKFLETLED